MSAQQFATSAVIQEESRLWLLPRAVPASGEVQSAVLLSPSVFVRWRRGNGFDQMAGGMDRRSGEFDGGIVGDRTPTSPLLHSSQVQAQA